MEMWGRESVSSRVATACNNGRCCWWTPPVTMPLPINSYARLHTRLRTRLSATASDPDMKITHLYSAITLRQLELIDTLFGPILIIIYGTGWQGTDIYLGLQLPVHGLLCQRLRQTAATLNHYLPSWYKWILNTGCPGINATKFGHKFLRQI